MIQSNQDLYQEINKIINSLEELGKYSFAKELRDAFTVSTIPSEVFGETRIVLIKLEHAELPATLREDIKNVLFYLNKIL